MNIKVLGTTCLILAVGFFAWSLGHSQQTSTAAQAPSGQIGRYQVVTATIDFSSMGGTLQHKAAIRIDTQTGRTWELNEIDLPHGGGSFDWIPLNDPRPPDVITK